jgi:hypothetical protein
MQLPFRITGDPTFDWIILACGGLFCLYWLRGLRLAREGARLFLENLCIAILVLILGQALLVAMSVRPNNAVFVAGLAAVLVFLSKNSGRRSRHISKSVRNAVIARDLKGKPYDSSKHHIDHVWPFSKGGSSTADNLRVVEKKKNLKKGAKRPRLWEMW